MSRKRHYGKLTPSWQRKHLITALNMRNIATPLIAALIAFFVAPSKANERPFKIFSAIHYKQTPDLSTYGIQSINLIYENKLTRSSVLTSKIRVYDSKTIRKTALATRNKQAPLVSLDMESWGVKGAEDYARAIKDFKNASPASIVGMYGYMPYGNKILYNYYRTHEPELLTRWKNFQKDAAPVASAIEVDMPSLYTWGDDEDAWKRTAVKAIQWARQNSSGKPVYAYIWPQYYTTRYTSEKDLHQRFIPAKVWRNELETLYSIADGVIIWSSDKDADGHIITFETSMPWFQETIRFMHDHDLH